MTLSQKTMDFINSPEHVVSDVPDELFVQGRFDPKLFKPIDLIKSYELNRNVKCIFGHDHRKGFVVLFEGGNYGVMGPECARDIFGPERCAQLQKNFRKRVNQEKTEATIRPNLLRNHLLMQLLPQLSDVAREKDGFFTALDEKNPDFVKKLKTAALSAHVGEQAIDFDTFANINYAQRHLQNSSECYNLRPVVEANTAKAEDHYFRAKRGVLAVLNDLEAASTFFLPAALASCLRYIENDRVWEGRVEITPGTLRVDDHTLPIPIHIPGKVAALQSTIGEIKAILNRPLSEFKLAA